MQCLTLIQTCNTDSDLPEMEVSMVMSTGTEVLEVGAVVKVTLTSSNLELMKSLHKNKCWDRVTTTSFLLK